MSNTELLKLTISELAPKIKARQVSPVEITEAALAQADRLQPSLNSFITILHEKAMKQAKQEEKALVSGDYKGPLHGIPIGIKDNMATAGIRTTVGSRVLANHVPIEDAHVVRLCKEAGAIILGKENLEEFASGATTNNPHYGIARNPWSLDRTPGGSSGGGGANVAASVTFASLGSDLGGSVRLPACFCGVVGLKQTFGLVSQRGLLGTAFIGDHIGPMTRSVQDSALVLQTIAGYDALDPTTVPLQVPDYCANLEKSLQGLTMGIPTDHHFDIVDPEVEAAVRQAIAKLEELGVESKKVPIPSLRYVGVVGIAMMVERLVTEEPYIRARREEYSADILFRRFSGQFVLARDYVKALRVQRIITEEHARVLQSVDFLVMPTSPVPAPPVDAATFTVMGTEYALTRTGAGVISRNTVPANVTGLPAISVPCGFDKDNLPIGLQLVGRPFDEALLFQVAHQYEAASPSRGRRPAIVDAE